MIPKYWGVRTRVWAFLLRLKGAETVCKKLCRVLNTTAMQVCPTKISTMCKNLKVYDLEHSCLCSNLIWPCTAWLWANGIQTQPVFTIMSFPGCRDSAPPNHLCTVSPWNVSNWIHYKTRSQTTWAATSTWLLYYWLRFFHLEPTLFFHSPRLPAVRFKIYIKMQRESGSQLREVILALRRLR